MPDAYEGVSYSFTVSAAGGNSANYSWSVSGQPTWLTIDATTGELSGTPPVGSAGTYTFTVEVTDGQQTASKQFDLEVKAPPLIADFEASPTYGTASLTVNFTDRSAGNPTSWEWDFDNDGTPDSTDQNPSWTYNNPGWYTVKLTVSNGVDSNTCVKRMFILVANNIYYVDGVGGDDTNGGTDWGDAFATIGKALSVAGNYDLVLVADATYNETDLDFGGKKIYLKGVDHNTAGARPVIDCQQAGRAFYFGSGETKDSVVDNFIIQNGRARDSYGGAVVCKSSSPTIRNCVFENNRAVDTGGGILQEDGGAIYCDSCSPSISNCVFIGNSAVRHGGAIRCFVSSPSITNCIFSGNTTTYNGGAIDCEYSNPRVVNCTFSRNSAGDHGGAIACYYSNPTLNNSILWFNTAGTGNEVYVSTSSSCALNYCCVDGTGYGGQTGNITENNCIHSDPQFVLAANDDYHLKPTSPCIDAGDNSLVPSGVNNDLEGNQRIVDGDNDGTPVVDIGAYEYQMQITTTRLPDAVEGVAYSYTVQATGGNVSNYSWSISGQPSWLSINAATGELSGTPPAGSAGTYTFTIEVTDGQRTASKRFVLVVKLLSADFEASPTQGKAPLTVNFIDKSRGNITQWQWDFDNDGTVDSTQQNPTYTYSDPGWYTVKLTVTSSRGSDSCVKEMYILVVRSGVYYVDGVNGDDANGGSSWSDAFATIGKALSVAGDYDLVLVADATYSDKNLQFGGKKIYLRGVDHNNAGQRPVIDCRSSGRAFYFNSGEKRDCVIDNFTIKNGSSDLGGAIRCENSSSPSIINCTISNSRALYGGAICCKSSSPSIVNCTFDDNRVDLYGGAIFCDNSSNPSIVNCTFSGNSASLSAGAIWCDNSSSPTVTDCTFSSNTADNYYGGAIFCQNSSNPTLSDCIFNDNTANWHGGAIYCDGGSLTLTNCIFSGNSAANYNGGAIYCNSSSPTVTNCAFSDNSAADFGGAIYCCSGSPSIVNCEFSTNSANESGGAIYCDSSSPKVRSCTFSGNSACYYGGAICCRSSNPTVTNCVFSGNTSNNDGGAVYCCDSSNLTMTNCTFSGNSAKNFFGGAIECYNSSSAALNNSILWGNSAGGGGDEVYPADSGSSCTLNHCCVDSAGYGGSGTIDESNCVHDDPRFVDAAGGDYHLQDTSPCIDAGDNSLVPSGVDKDLDGNPRIVNGTVDIGAYEHQP